MSAAQDPPKAALFLDRDGVINEEAVGSYILRAEDFRFLDGVLPALALLAGRYQTIVVVTNQRGVGRGVMTMSDLEEVHARMLEAVHAAGGRIDRVYAATAVEDDAPDRKPAIGMALQAAADFPQISLKLSTMVGNTMSDMKFGKRAGMQTVFITTKLSAVHLPHPLIDEQYPSLAAWVAALAE